MTDYPELYCDTLLVILIGVCFVFGIIVGAVILSALSDMWGRKKVLLLCQALFAIAATIVTFLPHFYVVLALLFLIGFACSGGTIISYLYINEILASKKRAIYGALINSSFAVAGVIYFTAYQLNKEWVYIAYSSVIIDLLAGFILLFYFKESPRYLLSNDRVGEAIEVFKYMAEKNGRVDEFQLFLNNEVSGYNADEFKTNTKKINSTSFGENKLETLIEEKSEKTASSRSAIALFKYKSLRTPFLVCSQMWFTYGFVYYGISMDLKKSENVFKDGYVVYVAEGIAYLISCIIMNIEWFGRIRTLRIMMGMCCVSTLVNFLLTLYDLTELNFIALFFSRFSITTACSCLYTYSTEIYPTVIRAKGLGFNALSARFAAILVPIIDEKIHNPFYLFAIVSGIAFGLSWFLEETFGKPMEDEIREEKILKEENNNIQM
jgi:OCT family organic cation transporter-like MFS transporter 4/5